MMIAKRKRGYLRFQLLQIVHQLLGRCNACEQHDILSAKVSVEDLTCENSLWRIIIVRREEQLLIRIQFHRLGYYAELHRIQILRALCNNHYVGPILCPNRLAQAACRQQAVINKQTVIVYQQYINAGLYISVLECVVKQYNIQIQSVTLFCKLINTPGALLVNRHCYIRELLLYLIWLITYHAHWSILIREYKTTAFTFISAT